jgi:hypothetical protein
VNSPIFALNVSNIPEVSAYLDSEKVRLKFRGPLIIDSWHSLLQSIDEFMKTGLLTWEFDFTELEYPGSTDMGMWVTCNSRVKLKGGRINFLVKRDSQAHTLLEHTKLTQILNVVLTS